MDIGRRALHTFHPVPLVYLLKGQCHEIFGSGLFSWIIYPQVPENNIRVISNFSKIHEDIRKSRCPIGINDTAIAGSELEGKNLYFFNSTTKRCPNTITETFLIEDFFHLPLVSMTPVVHLELRISQRFFEKIWNGPNGLMVYSCLGQTDSWKNLKSKISLHCPFKQGHFVQEKSEQTAQSVDRNKLEKVN